MISLSTTRRYWEYMKLSFKSCLPIKTKIDNPTGIIIQWSVTHIASRPPLRWLVYTVMGVIQKSSYPIFSQASEVAESKVRWIIIVHRGFIKGWKTVKLLIKY